MLNQLKKRRKKGFTLIELIIVIAIIAIIAAIAIPKYVSVKESANAKTDLANAKTIYNATVALIAEGELDYTDTEVTLGDGSTTSDLIEDYLDGDAPTGKQSGHSDENFTVQINSEGSVVIYLGSDQIYPEED